MFRKKEQWLFVLLCGACLGVLALGMGGLAQAAYPTARAVLQSGDPYHHLSGVVVIPPSRLVTGSGAMAPGGVNSPSRLPWAGLLTPPVFGPNVDATNNNAAAQNETTASINPDNDQIIIGSANDYRNNLKPEVYRTTDGGTTWVDYQVPGAGALYYGDPAVTSDHNNYSYFSYLGYTSLCSGQGGMYASRSTDAGATMSPPIQLAANSVDTQTAIFNDKDYLGVDSNPASPYAGNVYVAWTRFIFQSGANCGTSTSQLGAPIVITRSTDRGVTWTSPITASQVFSNNNSFVSPVIGRHGEVYLYYLGAATQQQPNYDTVLFSRSTDGGQTFPFFTHISSMTDLPSPLPPTSFRDNGGGSMAADQQLDNYLYAVWADYGTGDADIRLSRSTDNGNTWGASVRLNDDPIGNGKDQFFPWIASAPDGYIHVGWFDRRDDPTNHNYEEYYTFSSDHGATWAPNVAVSSAPSVPGNSNFIGDYSGIAASTGVVMPIWTDIRSGGNQNAYVARGVYTAGPPPTGTPPTTTPTTTRTNTGTPTNAPQATNTATSTSTPPAPTNTPLVPTGTSTAPSIASPTRTPAPGTVTRTPAPTATACTLTFSDVPVGSTFYPYIHCLVCLGIVSGYPDGTFKPNNPVTRGQLSKIVSNSAGFSDTPTSQQFQDVPPTGPGSTFYVYIYRLVSRGYIGGYRCGASPAGPCVPPDNLPYFLPNANATRGQISKIVSNAAGFLDPPSGQQFQDVAVGSTFYEFIFRLSTRGIINGYLCGGAGEPCIPPGNLPYFRPNADATRGQMSKIDAAAFFPDCNPPQQ
jgi:hypothetical protein